MIDATARVEALRRLAALFRVGLSARQALTAWHDDAPEPARDELARLARRLELGEPIAAALGGLDGFERDRLALVAVIAVHLRAGGDAALMVDGLAHTIAERQGSAAAGRAAGAGAVLSGRMVGALPLVFLPMLPMARAPLLDAVGLVLLASGLGLALAGMKWISGLVPRPPSGDVAACVVADTAASVVSGGATLGVALDAITDHAPDEVLPAMQRARRLVALGCSWSQALERSGDEDLALLATVIARSESFGLPASDVLREFASALRDARAREFEAVLKRAPVVMVLPLVLCVLPSFALLALGPFLRGLLGAI